MFILPPSSFRLFPNHLRQRRRGHRQHRASALAWAIAPGSNERIVVVGSYYGDVAMAVFAPAALRLYAQHDAVYNVTALVDTFGNVDERFIYDPYGTVTVLEPVMDHRDGSVRLGATSSKACGSTPTPACTTPSIASTAPRWNGGCRRTRQGMWMG